MKKIQFSEISGYSPGYLLILGITGLLAVLGLGAAWYMEHNGHWVTGMNNEVVWGTPHVFAVFLIVAASGALNVASISSVFQKKMYKPLARLSGLLAIALLAGGLMVLVLHLCLEYLPVHGIFCCRHHLYVDHDGTQDESLHPGSRHRCIYLAPRTDYWYRLHFRFPRCTSGL
jgi:hypothetical protein